MSFIIAEQIKTNAELRQEGVKVCFVQQSFATSVVIVYDDGGAGVKECASLVASEHRQKYHSS